MIFKLFLLETHLCHRCAAKNSRPDHPLLLAFATAKGHPG
jgi:hypothetical protein